jgi:hypothetical protein
MNKHLHTPAACNPTPTCAIDSTTRATATRWRDCCV